MWDEAGTIGSSVAARKQQQEITKQQEEATRRLIYSKVLGDQKTNWTPIIVVGGILIIGGIVFYQVMKRRKNG